MISYLGRTFRLRDAEGLHYIARLLRHPNERFHALELSASVSGEAPSASTFNQGLRVEWEDAPHILNSKAKADYRARLSELRADLEETEQMKDGGRAEQISLKFYIQLNRDIVGAEQEIGAIVPENFPQREAPQNFVRARDG